MSDAIQIPGSHLGAQADERATTTTVNQAEHLAQHKDDTDDVDRQRLDENAHDTLHTDGETKSAVGVEHIMAEAGTSTQQQPVNGLAHTTEDTAATVIARGNEHTTSTSNGLLPATIRPNTADAPSDDSSDSDTSSDDSSDDEVAPKDEVMWGVDGQKKVSKTDDLSLNSDSSDSDDSDFEDFNAAVAKMNAMDGDDSDDSMGHSKNKKGSTEARAPIDRLDTITVLPQDQLASLGFVHSFVEAEVMDGQRFLECKLLIKGNAPAGEGLLELGATVCTPDRSPIGKITDNLGKVTEPIYVIDFHEQDGAHLKQLLNIGQATCYVRGSSAMLDYAELKSMKGTDANDIGEEEEPEFSDDEAEREYRRSHGKQRQTKQNRNRGNPRGRAFAVPRARSGQPRSSFSAMSFDTPTQNYGGGMDYGDDDGYNVLRRPTETADQDHERQMRPTAPYSRGRGGRHGRGFRDNHRGNRGNGQGYNNIASQHQQDGSSTSASDNNFLPQPYQSGVPNPAQSSMYHAQQNHTSYTNYATQQPLYAWNAPQNHGLGMNPQNMHANNPQTSYSTASMYNSAPTNNYHNPADLSATGHHVQPLAYPYNHAYQQSPAYTNQQPHLPNLAQPNGGTGSGAPGWSAAPTWPDPALPHVTQQAGSSQPDLHAILRGLQRQNNNAQSQ